MSETIHEKPIRPSRLNKGDTLVILAPSSGLPAIYPNRIHQAKEFFEQEGFQVQLYPSLAINEGGKAGSPSLRMSELHRAFQDPKVKGIICAIGGLAANELVEKLDYDVIKNNPKIFCGYSDITHLHFAIFTRCNLVTFYGPAAMTQFGEWPNPFDYTWNSFCRILQKTEPYGIIKSSSEWTQEIGNWDAHAEKKGRKTVKNEGHIWIKGGKAKGRLVAGCLYSIHQIKGTSYMPRLDDAILFIENSEGEDYMKPEPLSNIDTMLMDLRNTGIFNAIRGLVVGRAYLYRGNERDEFLELIRKHTKNYSFPVVCNVDFGHTDPMLTLPIGCTVELDSTKNKLEILDPAVC